MLRLMLAFAAGALALPAVAVASPGPFAQRPTYDDLLRVYPPAALAAGLDGRATLSCRIGSDLVLGHCSIVAESPQGQGFGEAALRLAPLFRVRVAAADGRPAVGAQVRIPVLFRANP